MRRKSEQDGSRGNGARPARQDWSHFIVQNTPGAVITADGQGRISQFNRAAEGLTGYSREEVLGRPAEEILHCEGDPITPLDQVLRGQGEGTREVLLSNRSGQKVPVMISSFTLRDEAGTPRGGAIIIRDLTPVKRVEQERRHLVNMFAHDLKTPVVGVAGLIRRLLAGKVGPLSPSQRTYLETVHREMRQLELLITRFLEFARLDLRILTPAPEVFSPLQACQEVIALLLPLAEAKGMTLKAEFPPETPDLRADPLLFRRLLENLLENAIKYGAPQDIIGLKCEKEENNLRFAVQDHGPGISAQELPHLFEIFYRGQESGRESGFGLGLATVKRIIDAHGGRLWVDTGRGRGTTFFFTFPLASPPADSKTTAHLSRIPTSDPSPAP
jgi:PAS domain S-box-containing protein